MVGFLLTAFFLRKYSKATR